MPKATAAPAPWVIVLSTIAGFLGAMGLIVATEDVLVTAARNWPGGPMGFAVTLGFLVAAGVLVAVFYGVAGKWPHRVGPRLRVGARAKLWIMTVAGVLSGLALLVLLSTLTLRSTSGSPPEALLKVFVGTPGATVTGLAVALVALVVGGLALAGNIGGDTPRERADLMVRMCGVLLVLALLIALFTSAVLLQDDYFALAEKWPGGPRVFLLCAGACVPLGVAGAIWAAKRRARLTRAGTALLMAPSIALATASLSVLIAALPPRGYRGPILCEEGLYCLIDKTHGQAGLTAGLGWLAVPVAAVVLGYAAVKVSKRRR